MKKTLVEKYVEDPIHMRLYQQERAIYEVTELLESLMEEVGVSRSELARRLGKSKGWVTQLLDGEANKTIRTVADAFAVLGREYRSFQSPIHIGNKRDQISASPLPAPGTASRIYSFPTEGAVIKLYEQPDNLPPVTAQQIFQEEAL